MFDITVMQQVICMCSIWGLAMKYNCRDVFNSAVKQIPSTQSVAFCSLVGINTVRRSLVVAFQSRHSAVPRLAFSHVYWTDWSGHTVGQFINDATTNQPTVKIPKWKFIVSVIIIMLTSGTAYQQEEVHHNVHDVKRSFLKMHDRNSCKLEFCGDQLSNLYAIISSLYN